MVVVNVNNHYGKEAVPQTLPANVQSCHGPAHPAHPACPIDCTAVAEDATPPYPAVSLQGQNCTARHERRPNRNAYGRDLNAFQKAFNYEELCADLKKPLSFPPFNFDQIEHLPASTEEQIPAGQKGYVGVPTPVAPLSLSGKNVLVIGGSKNIGKAIADKFFEDSLVDDVRANVIATSRHPDCYPDSKVPMMTLDVTDTQKVRAFFKELECHFAKIDVLVLCPGMECFGELADYNGDEMTDMYNLMCSGYQRVVHQALPLMKHANTRIISLGSTNAYLLGSTGLGGYTMAKRALQAWNDCHYGEALLRKASGASVFEPSFSLVEPGLIHATFGLTEFAHAGAVSACHPRTRHAKLFANVLNNLPPINPATGEFGTPNTAKEVGEAVFDIARTQKPGVRYIVDNGQGGLPFAALVAQSNTLSADNWLNAFVEIGVPIFGLLPTLKGILADTYCPPSP